MWGSIHGTSPSKQYIDNRSITGLVCLCVRERKERKRKGKSLGKYTAVLMGSSSLFTLSCQKQKETVQTFQQPVAVTKMGPERSMRPDSILQVGPRKFNSAKKKKKKKRMRGKINLKNILQEILFQQSEASIQVIANT